MWGQPLSGSLSGRSQSRSGRCALRSFYGTGQTCKGDEKCRRITRQNSSRYTTSIYGMGERSRSLLSGTHQRRRLPVCPSRRSSELRSVVFQSLDLTPGHGNLLGRSYWELISPWRGDASTLNTGVSPEKKTDLPCRGFCGQSAEKILFDQESLFRYPA